MRTPRKKTTNKIYISMQYYCKRPPITSSHACNSHTLSGDKQLLCQSSRSSPTTRPPLPQALPLEDSIPPPTPSAERVALKFIFQPLQ
ncbi:hypothetical protein AXF42_Ash014970 [Apostasia shenzhenica]|uniref:Uncharacterized protein n=1 Tax=Apostasia shenzhenica TaxID=1088818 RepID=A0A2I0ALY1_9ASPA|nr:hypothetical protein AXF42_Ash014970 [Apostasia shenzhenica]